MLSRRILFRCLLALAFAVGVANDARAQEQPKTPPQPKKQASEKKPPQERDRPAAKTSSPADELQEAISNAGSDRAALVRNLEAYLIKYPDSPQRPQIYRALVEAELQLRDTARAADYAERVVALTPDDMNITLVAIQLLQRNGDEAGVRRAINYTERVLAFVDHTALDEKSPQMSPEEWKSAKARDVSSVLLLRGQLHLKLKENASAQKDFEASYTALPTAAAAEKLAEVAELNKDLNTAIREYARAFALADGANTTVTRREIRQKIGNVWRQAHGSEDGLGEFLLHNYDETVSATSGVRPKKNADAHQVYEFTVRKAPDGATYPLAGTKGEVVVVNFWATWCGPCRALKPQFERVAAQFSGDRGISFLEADCDEDETLVPAYLEELKPTVTVVFADGLDRFLAVNSLPTVVVIGREGKITYRSEGFGGESFERELVAASRKALEAPTDAPRASVTP